MKAALLLLISTTLWAQSSFYVATGKPTSYTDSTGQLWQADNGTACTGGTVFHTTTNVTGTPDPTLYQYGRSGTGMSCTAMLGVGVYTIRLKFADVLGFTVPGQQVFNIYINGTLQKANFDIFGTVRAQNVAYDVVLPLYANLGTGLTVQVNQVATGTNGAQLQAVSFVLNQTGGSSDWITQINKPLFDIRTYGAQCNGVSDDTAAINSAIADASAAVRGGVVLFPPGICLITSPITITADNVILQGMGGWSPSGLCHPEGAGFQCLGISVVQASGTWSSGSYMFTFDGSGQSRKFLLNPGVRDLDLNANGKAGGLIKVKQINGGDFYKLHLHDHFTASPGVTYGFYFESTNVSVDTGGDACGNNGGYLHMMDVEIQSYRQGAAGMQIGTPGTTYDVCSNRFVNVTIEITNEPYNYGLWLPNTDSNEWTNIFVEGANVGKSITSILATSTTTATITVPGHGIPSGTQGVYIFNPCTIATVGTNCGGTQPPGLAGAFTGTVVDANTISIVGAQGLTNGVTYYATTLYAVDVAVGGCANCGGNMFSNLTGSLYMEPGPSGYGTQVANWNWITDNNFANPIYQKPGGSWVNKVFADSVGNFQSYPSFQGNHGFANYGQIKVDMTDYTGSNFGTNQQRMAFVYDGGQNITGGALSIQNLTDANTFLGDLIFFRKDGQFQLNTERIFSALPGCSTVPGSLARVSDSNTAVWGAGIAGGGANHVLAFCNGSSWTVMAK